MARTSTATTKAKEETVTKPEAVETPKEEVKETKREYTEAEIQALVNAAVAKALENVSPKTEDDTLVTLLYIGGIAEGTTVALEGMGNIIGDGGMLSVPKKTFFSNLGAVANLLLRNRQLIVIDGLTDDERSRYGVLYTEGELMSAAVFQKLLDYSVNELKAIYRNLCKEHREIATRVIHSAAMEGDGRVTPDKLKAILRIDREKGDKGSPLEGDLKAIASDVDAE